MNIFVFIAALRGTAMGLFLPLWILYFSDQGFDLLAIGLFGAVFELAKLFFEIPTGTFADKVGVRLALVFSYLLSVFTWGLFPLIHIKWIPIFVMGIWALSEALISGAFETWMSQVVKKEDFGKYLMRNTQVMLVFIIIVSLVSGHLYRLNAVLPFLLVAAVYIVLTVLTMIYCRVKPAQSEPGEPEYSFSEIMKNSFRLVLSHRRVLNVVLAGFFSALTYDVLARYWQPYLKNIGFSADMLGYVMAIAGVLAFLLLQFTLKMRHVIEKYTLLSLTLVDLVWIVLLLLLSIGFKYLGIVSTSLLLAVEDIRNPVVNSYLNKFFPDSYKATLFSINSGMGAAGEILSGVIFGLIAVKYGLSTTFMVAAISLLPALFFYNNAARLKEKKEYNRGFLNQKS